MIQILKWLRLFKRSEPKQIMHILDMRDGDKLIIKSEERLTADDAAKVRAAWEEFLQSGRKVAVVDSRFTLAIFRNRG